MKPYHPPSAEVVEYYPSDGVLNNASNEGYSVDPFNPGFSSLALDDFSSIL